MNKAHKDKIESHRSGQLLIEMLVALGILTVGFLGVMSLLSRAIGLNRVVADNYTATYLAEEGIEIVKNILDGNVIQGKGWNEGFGIGNGDFEVDFSSDTLVQSQDRFLTLDQSANLYGYGFSSATPFKRVVRIDIDGSGGNEIIVNSEVGWVSRGGNYNVNLEDHFFNWR